MIDLTGQIVKDTFGYRAIILMHDDKGSYTLLYRDGSIARIQDPCLEIVDTSNLLLSIAKYRLSEGNLGVPLDTIEQYSKKLAEVLHANPA